jgi:hypothetical protein
VQRNDIQNKLIPEEGIAGYDLAVGFLNLHPRLSVRNAGAMTCGRAECLDQGQTNAFFAAYKTITQDFDLMSKSQHIYNVGESGM